MKHTKVNEAFKFTLGATIIMLVVLSHVHNANVESSRNLEAMRAKEWNEQVRAGELEIQEAKKLEKSLVEKVAVSKKVNLYDFFAKYAPDSDNNNSREYARAVAENMNIDPNKPVEPLQDRIPEFAKQIAIYEGYYADKVTLAMTHNNPGNLKYIGQKGAVKGEYGFAKFKSENDGWSALHRQIARDIVREKN